MKAYGEQREMKVSVITVSRNGEREIQRTIESVLQQNENEIEYWIIDGNSSDQTVKIAESFRLRMEEAGIDYHIISEPDKGIYDAMNKGICLSGEMS